jgi:hypothetical protein
MPVSAVSGFSALLPLGPVALPTGAGGFTVPAPPVPPPSAAALAAMQQVEEIESGVAGAGTGAHAHKAALRAIEDVAARVGLRIESHEKNAAERDGEIERLKQLADLRAAQVNPRQDGDGGGAHHQQPQDGRQPGPGREQPAAS